MCCVGGSRICTQSLYNPSFSDTAGVCMTVRGTVKRLQWQDKFSPSLFACSPATEQQYLWFGAAPYLLWFRADVSYNMIRDSVGNPFCLGNLQLLIPICPLSLIISAYFQQKVMMHSYWLLLINAQLDIISVSAVWRLSHNVSLFNKDKKTKEGFNGLCFFCFFVL